MEITSKPYLSLLNKYKHLESSVPWWIQSNKPWKRNYISSGKYRRQARRKARRMYNNISKTEKLNNSSYKKIYDVWWAIF